MKVEFACSVNDLGTRLKNTCAPNEDQRKVALEILEDDAFVGNAIDPKLPIYERLYAVSSVVDPSYAPSWYNRGVAYGERGDVEGATRSYLRSIALHPEYTEALCNLGAMLRGRGDYENAVKRFEQSLRTAPNNGMIRSNLAAALCEWGTHVKHQGANGDKDGNKSKLLSASASTSLVSSDASPSPSEAEALGLHQDALQKAIKLYEWALSLEPRHPLVLYNLGVAYAEAGEKRKAIGMYELAITFAPACAEAWNNLGVILREVSHDTTHACFGIVTN